MRPAADTDFSVDVEGIGHFRFARRRLGDEMRIWAEYSRITEGVPPTKGFGQVAGSIAAIKVLMVEADPPFVMDDMDPLDPKTFTRIVQVHDSLREKEESFRSGAKPPGKT
jgi:hypothetical protein